MISSLSEKRGLRLVAAFEAAKGLIVLIAGFGLLTHVHRDIKQFVEEIILHFHLNPAKHYPQVFIDLAANITSTQLWLLSVCAFIYSFLRLAEAYGLWVDKAWAAWMAVITGAIYIPVEVYEILSGATRIKFAALTLNLLIVVYMLNRLRNRKSDHRD